MDAIEQKALLRKQARAARSALSANERQTAEQTLTHRLLNLPAVKHAKTIGVYKAVGAELSLDAFVSKLGELEDAPTVAYPLIISDTAMVFMRVGIGEDLGVLSDPMAVVTDYDRSRVIPAHDLDLLLVPGVAFDAECNRLGQGGGYYDRYLPLLKPECLSVGIAFDEQVVESVPVQGYDHKVDYVVTPTQIYAI